MQYRSYKQEPNPISLGLIDLFAYGKSSKSVVKHIKIIYNLETNSCLIDANLSNEVATTEITNSLMSQIDYLISSLIQTYTMVYNRAFLNKIVFEADLDVLGIIYESIKVSCLLKTNIQKLNIDSWNVVKEALEATVNAERAEVVDRPATSLEMVMKRKKVRCLRILFDYATEADEAVYETSFSQAFMSTLRVILQDYCNYSGSHQVSCNLCFSLQNRETLKLNEGTIYPSFKLHTFSKQFSANEAKYIIMQLNQVFSLVPNSKISSLKLTRHIGGTYVTNFGLKPCDKPVPLEIDLTTSEGLAKAFTNVVKKYSLPAFYQEWGNTINVYFERQSTEWTFQLKSYDLVHPFKDKQITVSNVKLMFEKVNRIIQGTANINQFTLIVKNNTIDELTISITSLEEELGQDEVKPMSLSSFNNANMQNTKLFYNFEHSANGYFLNSERYLGWSKL